MNNVIQILWSITCMVMVPLYPTPSFLTKSTPFRKPQNFPTPSPFWSKHPEWTYRWSWFNLPTKFSYKNRSLVVRNELIFQWQLWFPANLILHRKPSRTPTPFTLMKIENACLLKQYALNITVSILKLGTIYIAFKAIVEGGGGFDGIHYVWPKFQIFF